MDLPWRSAEAQEPGLTPEGKVDGFFFFEQFVCHGKLVISEKVIRYMRVDCIRDTYYHLPPELTCMLGKSRLVFLFSSVLFSLFSTFISIILVVFYVYFVYFVDNVAFDIQVRWFQVETVVCVFFFLRAV